MQRRDRVFLEQSFFFFFCMCLRRFSVPVVVGNVAISMMEITTKENQKVNKSKGTDCVLHISRSHSFQPHCSQQTVTTVVNQPFAACWAVNRTTLAPAVTQHLNNEKNTGQQ